MFKAKDFNVANISNLPTSKQKLLKLIEVFDNQSYSMKEIKDGQVYERTGMGEETFRKMVNHCAKIGILNYSEGIYSLSEETKKLVCDKFGLDEYILKILKKNQEVYSSACILITLLIIFRSLRLKTLYAIFSLVGKNRVDASAQSSTGRNLRAILALMSMARLIEKRKDEVVLTHNELKELSYLNAQPLHIHFANRDMVNTPLIIKYLVNFFEKDASEKILSCVSTYEVKNYIWSKSSLYKNQGEIKNLFGDYIMTVIFNKETSR